MAVRDWQQRSRRSIRGRCISAAGYTRCATSWRRYGSAIMTRSKLTPRPSTGLTAESTGPSGGARFLPALAHRLSPHGGPTGTRFARVVVLLPLSPTPVEEAAHHQPH